MSTYTPHDPTHAHTSLLATNFFAWTTDYAQRDGAWNDTLLGWVCIASAGVRDRQRKDSHLVALCYVLFLRFFYTAGWLKEMHCKSIYCRKHLRRGQRMSFKRKVREAEPGCCCALLGSAAAGSSARGSFVDDSTAWEVVCTSEFLTLRHDALDLFACHR